MAFLEDLYIVVIILIIVPFIVFLERIGEHYREILFQKIKNYFDKKENNKEVV